MGTIEPTGKTFKKLSFFSSSNETITSFRVHIKLKVTKCYLKEAAVTSTYPFWVNS